MPRDGRPISATDAETRRALPQRRGSGPTKQRGFVERATAKGHSGYGSESVRPHLRDQLRLKGLLPQPFPTADTMAERPGKDEHHH